MSFTHDLKLPTYEELECPIVNISSPALRAGSFHLAKYCDLQFKVSLSKIFLMSKKIHFFYFRNLCYVDRFVYNGE